MFFDSVLLVCGNSLVIKLDKDSKKEKKGLLKLFFGVFIKWKFCMFFLVLLILEVELGSVEFFFQGVVGFELLLGGGYGRVGFCFVDGDGLVMIVVVGVVLVQDVFYRKVSFLDFVVFIVLFFCQVCFFLGFVLNEFRFVVCERYRVVVFYFFQSEVEFEFKEGDIVFVYKK